MNEHDIRTLGHINEIDQIDFTWMDEKVQYVIASLHRIALSELLSRKITSVWDWEPRTLHMFERNVLVSINDVTSLTQGRVNRLIGCGYTTRNEVYEVFHMYHIKLTRWQPRGMNYQF